MKGPKVLIVKQNDVGPPIVLAFKDEELAEKYFEKMKFDAEHGVFYCRVEKVSFIGDENESDCT